MQQTLVTHQGFLQISEAKTPRVHAIDNDLKRFCEIQKVKYRMCIYKGHDTYDVCSFVHHGTVLPAAKKYFSLHYCGQVPFGCLCL